ncbi:MAG: protein kinase [Pyrinomonadaceae bacterium]
MTLSAGTKLGRYEIVSLIGAGGMGEVYLAKDTQLHRSIAIKILPAEFTLDKQHLHRFEREAHTASALNHQNILTVYEIGSEDGLHFIATEYVEGESLRERIRRTRLELSEALDIAIQIASALATAHESGIIHRDIKPENIMIRRDGLVKVLDFGLAKLIDKQSQNETDTEAPTKALVNTASGVIMGTPAYMSPEQARGKETDARTDIWSLGCVLYEMLAGHAPFAGETASDVIAAILKSKAAPLSENVPPELTRIVRKALQKKGDERYQTVKDFLIDLKQLKRELEFAEERERSQAPSAQAVRRSENATVLQSAVISTQNSAPHQASSAEYIATEIKRHKLGAAIIIGLLVLAAAGIGVWFYKFSDGEQKKTGISFQSAKFTRLTSTGKVTGAGISPDGKYVAHVVDDGGQQSLWVRHVATASNVQIVPPAEVRYVGLSFSPDGNYVYYTIYEKNEFRGTLYQVPVLGGAARKVLTGINSAVTFSPDGKRLAFIRFSSSERESALMIANADGMAERKLAARHGSEQFYYSEFSRPAWSPDGKIIACPAGTENELTVAAVSVESGEVVFFTSQKWLWLPQVAWLADGNHLLAVAVHDSAGGATPQIWQISYPAGEAQRVSNDLNSYQSVSLTANSDALATVQSEFVANVWMMPSNDSARATQITQGRSINQTPSWTPDGRIVYTSNANGNFDLYLTDARGSNPRQLTANSRFNGGPTISPDGRYIVFYSDRTGALNIWRMEVDGSNQTLLTLGSKASFSPDGRWIVYEPPNSGIWRMPFDGGEPVQLTERWSYYASISPDGRQVACFYKAATDSPIQIAVLPDEGGQPTKIFDPAAGAETLANLRWSADGRAIVYVITRNGVSNLWAQPVDGGQPKQITNFTSDRIFWFDFSRDGKQLALSRGTINSDVVLINNFK